MHHHHHHYHHHHHHYHHCHPQQQNEEDEQQKQSEFNLNPHCYIGYLGGVSFSKLGLGGTNNATVSIQVQRDKLEKTKAINFSGQNFLYDKNQFNHDQSYHVTTKTQLRV